MFKKGDKIWTEGPWGTRHYGVVLGYVVGYGLCVIHNDKGTGVVWTTFDVFSNGRPVSLEWAAPDDPWVQEEIIQRARSLLGRQYDLFLFNCEDLANYAQTGFAYSPQLLFFGLVAVGATALLYRALKTRP